MLFAREGNAFVVREQRGFEPGFEYRFLEEEPDLWVDALQKGFVELPARHAHFPECSLWVVVDWLREPERLLVAEVPTSDRNMGLLLRYTLVMQNASHLSVEKEDLPVWLFPVLEQMVEKESPLLVVAEPGCGQNEVVESFLRSKFADRRVDFFHPQRLSPAVQLRELFCDPAGARLGGANIPVQNKSHGVVVIREAMALAEIVQLRLLAHFSKETQEGFWIFQTSQDLAAMSSQEKFLPGLYRMLQSNRLEMAPLRKHLDQLPVEVERMLATFQDRYGRDIRLAPESMKALLAHPWPGNWQELRSTLESAFLLCSGSTIRVEHLMLGQRRGVGEGDDLNLRKQSRKLEESLLLQAYALHGGNQVQMARALGISRGSLQYKMEKYGLSHKEGV